MRRHLTQTQKAAIAVELLPELEAEAETRRKLTEGKPSSKLVEKIPPVSEALKEKSREKAAATVGVNPRYVSDAKRMKEQSPKLSD